MNEQTRDPRAGCVNVSVVRVGDGFEIKAESGAGARACTCHPDDSPPTPCQRKYALSECRAALGVPGRDGGNDGK